MFLQTIEKLVLAKLAHLDSVFESLAFAAEDRGVRCSGNGYHFQIQLLCQPSVESQLLFAEMLPAI